MPRDLFLVREGVDVDARGRYGTMALLEGDIGGRALGARAILGDGD